MMREKVRERSSLNFKQGVKRSQKDFEVEGRRYFREKLHSIFVNNINPVVDSRGLWGIFKPFGKVRDIYLFAKNSTRKSCFTFVRFETLEAAKKVAKLTDGMHVYGWPMHRRLLLLDGTDGLKKLAVKLGQGENLVMVRSEETAKKVTGFLPYQAIQQHDGDRIDNCDQVAIKESKKVEGSGQQRKHNYGNIRLAYRSLQARKGDTTTSLIRSTIVTCVEVR
ncbi:hypothetical protein LWI29_036422 [Acer saccharum]|uniref:RRM domain-containing protein n=1 Tax=Acer saccharum TaxID=4024 RepID=A0AA39SYQ6_ACESA|nr:hypothetical protein LWI29_036422 [Acer saccharum]